MKQLPFSVGSRRIPRALALVTVFATLSAAQAGTAIYISPSTKTMPTGWNGLDMVNSHAPILHKNLVDSEGNATSVGLLVMSPALGPWNNAGTAFTGDAAEFEPGRSAGSGCCAAMCAQGTSGYGLDDQEAFIRARVTGLDPAKLYEFSFVAQRYSSNDDDSARYTVVGANRGAASLLMKTNTTHVARIPGIAPLPDGSAEFTVVAADANTTSAKWAYLSAMKIEEMDALAAQDIYIDTFTLPSSSSQTWNLLGLGSSAPTLLKDALGNATHVSMGALPKQNNGNTGLTFTGDAAEFDKARNGGQIYLSQTTTTTVSGLYPNCTYSFTFVACRANRTGDSATACAATDYTVTGATTGTASLDAYNNASSVAKVTGIRPDEYGNATITIALGAGNNLGYAYLLAMKISRETMTSGDHAVAVAATDGGSVSATVGGEASDLARYLSASDTMVATATPAAGYRFVGWTSPGAATATANPLTIPGTSSATWTAVFEKDAAYPSEALYLALDGQPVAPTKIWNTASNETFYSRGAVQTGFRTSDNIPTDISLVTVQPFGLYPNGNKPSSTFQGTLTGDAADFNDGYSDYKWFHGLWVQIQWNGNTNRAYVAYDVAGLKPNRPYTFRFFGYRASVSDNRSARYWCEGQNAVMATLNPLNNTTQVATCADVVPDADGIVHMVFSPAPANNNVNLFTYHHMLSISGDLPLAVSGTVITFR